jgi:uncharacterized membrane protein YqgA involved in biofilm formation
MKNVIKSWKTTLLGIVLIAVGIIYVLLNKEADYIIMCLLIGTGIGFVFSPDDIIKLLKNKSGKL